MSRMSMIPVALACLGTASVVHAQTSLPPTAEEALVTYARQTATRPDCRRRQSGNEILVCGKREADRYRLPLIIKVKGDPRGDDLSAERERLQHITTPCQDNSVFLVGCGFAGVTVSMRVDGSRVKTRPLAD